MRFLIYIFSNIKSGFSPSSPSSVLINLISFMLLLRVSVYIANPQPLIPSTYPIFPSYFYPFPPPYSPSLSSTPASLSLLIFLLSVLNRLVPKVTNKAIIRSFSSSLAQHLSSLLFYTPCFFSSSLPSFSNFVHLSSPPRYPSLLHSPPGPTSIPSSHSPSLLIPRPHNRAFENLCPQTVIRYLVNMHVRENCSAEFRIYLPNQSRVETMSNYTYFCYSL